MILSPEHISELAKEFGGGFVAYWLHHVYQHAWRALRPRRYRPKH